MGRYDSRGNKDQIYVKLALSSKATCLEEHVVYHLAHFLLKEPNSAIRVFFVETIVLTKMSTVNDIL